MPVKNANQVKGNLRKAVAKIDKKAVQFVQAVVNDAGILSKTKAPLEYGTLLNSQQQDFTKRSGSYVGVLSYNTNYAAALNNPKRKKSGVLKSSANTMPRPFSTASIGGAQRLASFNMVANTSWTRSTLPEIASQTLSPRGGNGSWNPRPPLLKDGPAWNPDATPRFLEYGFESKEAGEMITANKAILKI